MSDGEEKEFFIDDDDNEDGENGMDINEPTTATEKDSSISHCLAER